MTDEENDRYDLIAECSRLADELGEAIERAEAAERRLRVADEALDALSLARAEAGEERHLHEWYPVPNSEWFACRGCEDRVSRERVLGDGVAIHEWHPGPA